MYNNHPTAAGQAVISDEINGIGITTRNPLNDHIGYRVTVQFTRKDYPVIVEVGTLHRVDLSATTAAEEEECEGDWAVAATLEHGDRLLIDLPGVCGEIPNNFTVVTTEGYAKEHGHDVAEWIERAKSRGHNLQGAFNEGSIIALHTGEPVERIRLALGLVVEINGQLFTIEPANNNQIEFKPAP